MDLVDCVDTDVEDGCEELDICEETEDIED